MPLNPSLQPRQLDRAPVRAGLAIACLIVATGSVDAAEVATTTPAIETTPTTRTVPIAPNTATAPTTPSTPERASSGIAVKTVAEVETRVSVNGHDEIRLRPAERVVPGDQVLYTLEIRNTGSAPIARPTVPYLIPEHMRYVADSAVGPGALVSFSVDGGRTFDRPEHLRVAGPSGVLRAATVADYTHIRWQLRQTLQRNSVAFARFRAVVK